MMIKRLAAVVAAALLLVSVMFFTGRATTSAELRSAIAENQVVVQNKNG